MNPSLDNYEITGVLGKGGTAVVYSGIDLLCGRRVAIKMLIQERFRDELIKEKFIEEANRYLYLSHPHIASMHDFVIQPEAYYLVMELIEGVTLDEYILTRSGPLSQENTIEFFLAILEGIAYAHHQDTIHLDIKPGNIMVTTDRRVKILDFGLSISKEEYIQSLLNKKEILKGGTPLYMAPEQIEFNHIDRRTDIYSLGVTLHQMITGKPPYDSKIGIDCIFELIRTQQLPRAKGLYPFVSDAMQDIIDKATAKNPEDRFQTCEEFEFHLEQLK